VSPTVNEAPSGRVRGLGTPRNIFLLVLALAATYAGVYLTTALVSERGNEARFRIFAQQIRTADHIIVTDRLNREPAFTIPGEDAKAIVRAVACARRWRNVPRGYDVPPFDHSLAFFAGTNALGAIRSNDEFVEFDGRRYHDDSNVMGHLIGRYWRPASTPAKEHRGDHQ
jgi:hypothetical protein